MYGLLMQADTRHVKEKEIVGFSIYKK